MLINEPPPVLDSKQGQFEVLVAAAACGNIQHTGLLAQVAGVAESRWPMMTAQSLIKS